MQIIYPQIIHLCGKGASSYFKTVRKGPRGYLSAKPGINYKKWNLRYKVISSFLKVLLGNPSATVAKKSLEAKSLKIGQIISHIIRATILILGVILVTVGVLGLLGSPGIIVGSVLIGFSAVLYLSLGAHFLKSKKLSLPLHPQNDPLFVKTIEALKNKIEEVKRRSNPEDVQKWTNQAEELVKLINHISISEDFVSVIFLWIALTRTKDSERLFENYAAEMIKIEYFVLMTGLQNSEFVIEKAKTVNWDVLMGEVNLFGASSPVDIITLTRTGMNSGLGLIRGVLFSMYNTYRILLQEHPRQSFTDPEGEFSELRQLYNNALDHFSKMFSMDEVRKIAALRKEAFSGIEKTFMHADAIYQICTHPDTETMFPNIKFVRSPEEMGEGGYETSWLS